MMFDIFDNCFQSIWSISYHISYVAFPFGFSGFWSTLASCQELEDLVLFFINTALALFVLLHGIFSCMVVQVVNKATLRAEGNTKIYQRFPLITSWVD